MVCPYSLSRPGGVQGQATGLAAALRRRGVSVTLVAPDDEQSLGRHGETYVAGRSHNVTSNGSLAPLALSPMAAFRADQLIANGEFDVVHLHEPYAPFLGYGTLLRAKAPLVGTFHRSGDSRWYELLRPLARWANERLSVRCAVSPAAEATAHRAMGGEYEVLFNGVDLERFSDASPSPSEQPTVVFLGRHEPRKGLEVLLAAFCELGRIGGQRAHLWVAGDGPQTAELMRRFPPTESLEWLGVLSDDEVARRIAGARVLCAPSLAGESFGMILVEAMAARRVVVASDIAGYRAAAAGHALLVPPGDIKALTVALGEALDQATSGKGVGASSALDAAYDHAAGWSMDRLASQYLTIYERVAGSSSGNVKLS